MSADHHSRIQTAEMVLPCTDLDTTLAFYIDTLGFRMEAIIPADDPTEAVISAYGVRIRLQRGLHGGSGTTGVLRLYCDDPEIVGGGDKILIAPDGTRVELRPAETGLTLPPLRQTLVVRKINAQSQWQTGRAGMQYRDLIPDRQGGRFIASHIRIADGGPVPDYVHFHKIRFQMIFCYKGWVRVVYEDQGSDFVMQAGDCVLQPPHIRHRVLESSPGLEVIEIACPAQHETRADHDLQLPTASVRPEREFGGQRFVYHQAATAHWQSWRMAGFICRDSGIEAATDGLAGVRVVRCLTPQAQERVYYHNAEFLFMYVLNGTITLACDHRQPQILQAGDACVIPAQMNYSLRQASSDLELLDVTLPARFANGN